MTDIEILAGSNLSFVGENRKARAAKRKFTEEDYKKIHTEKIQHLRKLNRIYTWGDDIPDPICDFSSLEVSSKLLQNITDQKITEPTPIQMQSIPIMLQNRDVLACAPTGSGKTLAFAIPIIDCCVKLKDKLAKTKENLKLLVAVVLEPTRVLAKQAHHQFERFSNGLPINCVFLENEIDSNCILFLFMEKRRFKNLESLETFQREEILSQLRFLVVDECDRLFDDTEGELSFRNQLTKIVGLCNGENMKRAFFSATFSYQMEEWCARNFENIPMVCIGARNSANTLVEQQLVFAGWEQAKISSLKLLIQVNFEPPALVFVQSKDRAKQLFVELKNFFKRMAIEMISSELTNEQCDKIITRFRNGHVQLLICTELIGRGLDFENVNLVVNFDLPTSIVSYIHRIGRTGRAGREGKAVTYFTESDLDFIRPIATVIHQAGFPVPEYLLHLKKVSKDKKKKLQKRAPERRRIAKDIRWKRLMPKFHNRKRKTSKQKTTERKTS